jgi:hypothetical protein
MAPEAATKVPTGAGSQAVAPKLSLNVPGEHGSSAVAPDPATNVPGLAGMHELPAGDVPVVDQVPGGHSSPCGASGVSPVAGPSDPGVAGVGAGTGQTDRPVCVELTQRNCSVEPGRGT